MFVWIGLAALALSASVNAETYQCRFPLGNESFARAMVETYTRSNDNFLRYWDRPYFDSEDALPIPIVRETPTAIFLLEDFQHLPSPKWPEDTGSFLLRIIDKQSLTFISVSDRFTEEGRGHRYRGNCILIKDNGEN